jgi:predicted dehydrogenase
MTNSSPVTILIIGVGARGTLYGQYAIENPDQAKVVAFAEPREDYSDLFAEKHDIAEDMIFSDWRELLNKPKLADAVYICIQDDYHAEPCIEFAKLGYDVLLEKPMATREEECEEIVKAVKESGVIFGVCHVMRYTQYTQALKKLLASGIIGEIMNIQHLEPVGYWHHAHSFVRGNWRRDDEVAFMLMAKSCHDIDWLRYVMDKKITAVSSFGGLLHFKKENQPLGAGNNCFDCGIEETCAFSAKKVYLGDENTPRKSTPYYQEVISLNTDPDLRIEDLKNGPYARCVYDCDNNVVDQQIVNIMFEGGFTASHTMVGLSEYADRKTRIFGTKGQIEGDGENIKVHDYLTENETEHVVPPHEVETAMDGHGGGDYYMVKNFVAAVKNRDQSMILAGPDESLETHKAVFAAEDARHKMKVNVID